MNLAFSWLIKRIFTEICALMIKAQKQHLKSFDKAKMLNLWRILANKAYQKADLWHFKVSKICKMQILCVFEMIKACKKG